jgi:ornithine decarboxylase
MQQSKTIWRTPCEVLRARRPDAPISFFAPSVLRATARRFATHFPGLVTYAVKANPDPAVLGNLAASGLCAFDVASPAEMDLVAQTVPGAVMHYNNPVRSRAEIAHAAALGVVSYSVDSASELAKLARAVPTAGTEIAVRFKLPLGGAVYDFGAKFGALPGLAADLLRRVARLGYIPALTFHPGTQCHDTSVWRAYIAAAAQIAGQAGVDIARLNVGGGFPSHRLNDQTPALEEIFDIIGGAVAQAFGAKPPNLLCEPGRAMVGDAFALATRVKAIRDGGAVFLNDGIYGGLAEHPVIGPIDRIDVISPGGGRRRAPARPRTVFGPTCDSIDKLPQDLDLPGDMAEGDYVIFQGLGAYSTSLATRFNGYGVQAVETVASLSF